MSPTTELRPGAHLAERADQPAVIMADTGAMMTYAELEDTAWRFAGALRSIGVRPGDHVALSCENRIDLPALYWGCVYAGTYFTWLSTRLAPDEIDYIVHDSDARVVVGTATTRSALTSAPAVAQRTLLTLDEPDGPESLSRLLAAASPKPVEDAVEGRDMLYSSGTTGRPKGVKKPLSGQPIGATLPLAGLLARLYGFDESAIYLAPAPHYHAAVCRWIQAVTALGGTAVMMPRFDAATALTAIERYGVTHSQWVPTMFRRILRLPEEQRRRPLPTHRAAIHAAAPCPVEVKRAMFELWGPIVHEYYAGTEGCGMTHCGPDDWLQRPGTVGRAVLGKLHILGRDNREVGPDEEGLICYSDGLDFEYHDDPAATARAHPAPGLATMGDVGRVDPDGYLYLTDRAAHMIITGGVNVYPRATEEVLLSHPLVEDAAVVGVPDDEFGEQVLAVVQLVDGSAGDDELAAALIAYCRERVSAIASPRRVEFRTELPREPTGKLRTGQLRSEYWVGRTGRLV